MIEIENPNRAQPKFKKVSTLDNNTGKLGYKKLFVKRLNVFFCFCLFILKNLFWRVKWYDTGKPGKKKVFAQRVNIFFLLYFEKPNLES